MFRALEHRLTRSPILGSVLSLFTYTTVLYATVFYLTRDMTVGAATATALENAVPLFMVGAALFYLTTMWTRHQSPWLQITVHLIGPPVFSLLWYLGIQIGRGINPSVLTEGLSPSAFAVFVIGWQVVQGSFAYAAVVIAAYWMALRSDAEDRPDQLPQGRPDRLLVRDKGTIHAVGLDDIVSISRRDDYSEIQTRTARYLSSRSLADLEGVLPSALFVRVHRSTIVNLNAVLGAEPTGTGRLTLSLPGGRALQTSRAGRAAFLKRAT